MSMIDLTMAVEVDMEQLDKFQEKMKQTDEVFLKKIEKATSILPKGAEKVNHAWLQMVSKVGNVLKNLVENIIAFIDLIYGKFCNLSDSMHYLKNNL